MGKFIVKYWRIILTLVAILLIPALIGFMNTRVNYDMLNYLPDSMETVIGQKELLDDFGKGAFSMIIIDDLSTEDEAKLETQIKEVDHVTTVLGLGTLHDSGLPPEFLPDNLYNTFHKGTESLVAVFFDTSTSADETISAITKIREIVENKGYVSGMSALVADLRNLSGGEEIFYILIAVALALFVMLLFLDNWLAPVLFLVSIGAMILINMGTNFVFGEISYITKALSAILQLAVTMDYSIFLWHSYREHLKEDKKADVAMEKAVKDAFSSVFGGSATTIAGFLALCFMTFTLGIDLGLVMAKGVLLGVIGSVTLLPALILAFHKILPRLDHRPLLPKFDKLSRSLVKIFPALIVVFAMIIPPAFYGYQKTNDNVYYEISKGLPSDMDFAIANQKLAEDFGLSNVHMILTSASLPEKTMRTLTSDLENIPGIKSVLNLAAIVPDTVPFEALPDSIVELLKSNKWELTLAISEYRTATPEISEQIQKINNLIKAADSSSLLVGEASTTQDMINLTSVDFQVVNSISIGLIFVIIAIVTKSISLPFILIIVIESAIFLNLGIPYYTGERLSFIMPICISTIQLGATVDYAILMTTRYKRERLDGHTNREAARIALSTSIPSIIVSGSVLFAATFGVAVYSSVDMIGSMCMLMARGAFISVFFVPLFLPPLLIFADPLIIRTTLDMRHLVNAKNALPSLQTRKSKNKVSLNTKSKKGTKK